MIILLLLILLLHYIVFAVAVSCHRLFFLVLPLNQWWSPPLRLKLSDYSTFCTVCDVLSIAVFCSESTECFPGMVPKFYFTFLCYYSSGPSLLPVQSHSSCPTFDVSLNANSCIFVSFLLLLLSFPVRCHCHICQFICFVFNYYSLPICYNFSVIAYPLIP